jgi:hypothetical protein
MFHLDYHIFQLQASLHLFSHPIDLMDIHLFHCTHGNEHMKTHDVVHNIFATIMQDVGCHMGWKQLHMSSSTMFNSFCPQVDCAH